MPFVARADARPPSTRRRRRGGAAALMLLAVLLAARSAPAAKGRFPVFTQVAGEIRTVVVEPGDTLVAIASRTGVPWPTIAAENRIADPGRIYPGQVLRVDTRRIVPSLVEEGWVVNVPEATLYVFEAGTLAARYPVGLGRPARPTPLGSFTILFLEENPTWEVPPSIQEEMRREGRVVRRKVPPGPDNPLGRYWIQLSIWGYGIHGTPFPTSVGQYLSHGCIRLRQADMEELFRRGAKGTRVEITYLPVKVAVTREGEVWAEAHPDVYSLGAPGPETVLAALEEAGVRDRVDEQLLREVLRKRDGVAHRVGKPPTTPRSTNPAEEGGDPAALWRCLDCPPGPRRRVTFQIEARRPVELPTPYPIEIRDDAGRVVFRPQMVSRASVHLEPGETRNFVWEVRDSSGQPLPPGSYTAVVRFFVEGDPKVHQLALPLWVGR